MREPWRAWAPDLAVGLVVAFFGLFEAATTDVYSPDSRLPLVFVALGAAASVALTRRAPGAALALVWAICSLQVLSNVPVMVVQLSIAAVAFGTARWGSVATVWLSAVSIPLAAVVAALLVASAGPSGLVDRIGNKSLVNDLYGLRDTWRVAGAIVGMTVLGAPWLAGLALRFGARAQIARDSQVAAERDAARAHTESEQAREIARLRDEQARLARDVHDVVGHSLAVILAQAESAQYLDDVDTGALKQTMATIATSARASLQDVRTVLTATQQPSGARTGGLDSLIEGVRASGHDVVSTEVGTPQPLPPELEVVAYRVLQEMLTNAIKHGRRDCPVGVERHWEGELRIEVRNVIEINEHETDPEPTQPIAAAGQGLDGMRRRLEAAGGRLDVRRREEPAGPTFTATAWVPVRTVVA
ncbi:MAG: histidine kinase, dimerization and phosphoacceptor region [Nocardioides sp.]|nr:histidine kinase, dimerization and phosphoacceptor region [Nocardioides sp.]